MPREFLATFSNEKFVVPICTAMGFAYVLRHTGCERHLVLLLVKPLRRVRFLLVPGVIAVGFLVNIPVISQTSTAVCIGPVVVPLMRAAGYSMATIGACLLARRLGGRRVAQPRRAGVAHGLYGQPGHPNASPTAQAQTYLPPLVFTQLAVSMLVYWVLSIWWERKEKIIATRPKRSPSHQDPTLSVQGRGGGSGSPIAISILKALVPMVPIALLFASGPPLQLFKVPQQWVVPRPAECAKRGRCWISGYHFDGSEETPIVQHAVDRPGNAGRGAWWPRP